MRAALFLCLALAACREAPPAAPPEGAVVSHEPAPIVHDPGPKPMLLTMAPPADRGPLVVMQAIVGDVLDLTGPCVSVQGADGVTRTMITAPGAALKRDSMGWFLPAGGDRLRHGATIEGGGGEMSSIGSGAGLAEAVPDACRTGPALQIVAIHRYTPGPARVAPPPPPAPAG